jgi:DNA-directed RNA polymerase subunit RPC12/RpoP
MKHICVDCGKEFDGPDIPKEIAEIDGTLMCPDCTEAEGLPTAKNLGVGV